MQSRTISVWERFQLFLFRVLVVLIVIVASIESTSIVLTGYTSLLTTTPLAERQWQRFQNYLTTIKLSMSDFQIGKMPTTIFVREK